MTKQNNKRRLLKRLLKDRTGSVSIFYIGMLFLLFSLSFVVLEIGGIMNTIDTIESGMQQAATMAVEGTLLDAYMADGILQIDPIQARADIDLYISECLTSDNFSVEGYEIITTANPPRIEIRGEAKINLFFKQYGFDDITIKYQVTSRAIKINY